MDINESTLVEDDSRRDARGFRRISPNGRQRYLEEFDCSGLTQRAFAKREGINYHTFISWLLRQSQDQILKRYETITDNALGLDRCLHCVMFSTRGFWSFVPSWLRALAHF